jgi:hypothetical protein
MNRELFEGWAAKGHFTDWARRPGRLEEIAGEVRMACEQIPLGDFWSTSGLRRYLLPEISEKGKAYLVSALQEIRRRGMLADCVRRGKPNQRTFGKPSVEWVNPVSNAGTEGLESIL